MSRSVRCLNVFLVTAFLSGNGLCEEPLKGVPPPSKDDLEAARSAGLAGAARAAEEVSSLSRGMKALGENGTLVAEGDSWFDYPFYNVLKMLRWRHGYRVESTAHNGDTLESMAYDTPQLAGLAEGLKRVADEGKVPRAILVSGGGNDIAGPELVLLLNHAGSRLPTVDPAIADALITRRLRLQMITLITAIGDLSVRYFKRRDVPVLIHGYDYPVPDGRGFLGGALLLPGPWIRPAFDRKGHGRGEEDLKTAIGAMKGVIDRYNAALASIPSIAGMSHVTMVQIPGTLTNDPARYTNDWGNELHPTRGGFERVAEKFHEAISRLPR